MPDSPLTRTAALAALGLPEGASTTEITRTFRRLAKRAHPDLADPTDPDAGRRFSALLEAYRTLTGEGPGPRAPAAGPHLGSSGAPEGARAGAIGGRVRRRASTDRGGAGAGQPATLVQTSGPRLSGYVGGPE